jgi:tRNA(fMet)-specific endonuclease VapC
MPWFLDSNVCIMHLRGRHPQLTARWQQHPAGEIFIPLPVYAELLVGAEKSSQRERVLREVESLLEAHEIVEVTEDAAAHYARIRADLEGRGAIIGANDLWIAALALTHDATLVTNNTGEFSRVNGLKLEDWSLPPSVE